MKIKSHLALAFLAAALSLGPAEAAGEIVIGASLPLSGPLAGFGIQNGRQIRTSPNLLASMAVFKFDRG